MTPMQQSLASTSPEELKEGALWMQADARYLYRVVGQFLAIGDNWVASKVQENAAYSAAMARAHLDKWLSLT